MKNKKILFVCKHNLFRSQVAEILFKKLNKNKNLRADSAGIIKWDRILTSDKEHKIEKRIAAKKGIKLRTKSRGLSSSLLKNTDVVVIVADDVHPSIFKDVSFDGKILVWKTKDVKPSYKNKEKVALNTINFIEEKVKNLIKSL